LPSLNIVLTAQAHQVPMKSIAENLRALHPERFRPTLNLSGFGIRNTKTKHRHTRHNIMYDTFRNRASVDVPPGKAAKFRSFSCWVVSVETAGIEPASAVAYEWLLRA
jgi:hypothetical protein